MEIDLNNLTFDVLSQKSDTELNELREKLRDIQSNIHNVLEQRSLPEIDYINKYLKIYDIFGESYTYIHVNKVEYFSEGNYGPFYDDNVARFYGFGFEYDLEENIYCKIDYDMFVDIKLRFYKECEQRRSNGDEDKSYHIEIISKEEFYDNFEKCKSFVSNFKI